MRVYASYATRAAALRGLRNEALTVRAITSPVRGQQRNQKESWTTSRNREGALA